MQFRQFVVGAAVILAVTLLALPAVVATVSAQSTTGVNQVGVTLPSRWNGPDSITQAELAASMPPFELVEQAGDYSITRVDASDGVFFRMVRTPTDEVDAAPSKLEFAWTAGGGDLEDFAGKVLTVSFDARSYSPPRGVRVFIEELGGTVSGASSLAVDDIAWREYLLARTIAPDATSVRVGVDWTDVADAAWVEFSPLRLQADDEAQFDGALAATDVPTPTPAAAATPALLVVTSTPTAESVFAAATQVAQATTDAASTGTATPTPESMVTATFTPTPTETPTPIVVTETPTPGNEATATMVALEVEARAFTTGTPTPFPEDAVVLVATATNTAAAQGRPTQTPTPLFVLLRDVQPTNTPEATPAFPAALANKILFKANFLGNDRRPDYMIMNPDGSDVARLTGSTFYHRAAERDHYSGDRRFYASVAREQDGFQRIQLFYDFIEFGTQHQLTFFGAGTAWDPAWSPVDETVVLVSNESKNDEIWLVHRGEWPAVKLTSNEWEWDNHPSFSPDGQQIVFMSNRNSGRRQLWIMDADGGNQRQLTDFPFEAWDPVWVKYSD